MPTKWEQARRLLRFDKRAADNEDTRREAHAGLGVARRGTLGIARAASVCVASGKGGTGKSLVSASLGCLFAERGDTLLVDGDLGVGNAHILQNVAPDASFVDLVAGDKRIEHTVTRCREGLDLIAGGSGFARMARLSSYEMHLVGAGIERLEQRYQYVIVDSAAGISGQTVAFAAASDLVLLVATPDITSMTDAYAFLKVLLQRRPTSLPLLVINRATTREDAQSAAERLAGVSRKFLGREPRWVGQLPEDRAAHRSIQLREPLVLCEPQSTLSLALQQLARELLDELSRVGPRGLGRELARTVGYSPRNARS